MDVERREIYRAIGELAYVVARSDKGLSSEERLAFYKIAEEELDYEAWAAESRFEILDEVIQPSIGEAYNDALHELRKYKDSFTDDLKEKALRVLQKVAACCHGLSANEAFVIDRFRKDLYNL